jgi:hypothetical protein
MPGAELYHVEGQSYPKELRFHPEHYNRWLQTELQGDCIKHVMASSDRYDPPK